MKMMTRGDVTRIREEWNGFAPVGRERQQEQEEVLALCDYIAALTALPEDVERDAVELDGLLIVRCDGEAEQSRARLLLSRIATTAARVPGLEAEAKRIGERLEESQSARGALANDVSKYVASLRVAESERDAARESLKMKEAEVLALQTGKDQLREERDAARQEVEAAWKATGVAGTARGLTTLDDVVKTHRDSLVETHRELEALKKQQHIAAELLSEVLDDDATAPGGFAPDASGHLLRCSPDLPARWRALRKHVATLTARVAELEAERKRLSDLCSEWALAADVVTPNDHRPERLRERALVLVRQADTQVEAEARATAAETEVKAVEDALWKRGYACNYLGRPAVEVAALVDDLHKRTKSQPAPTPAPGLREAVDKVLSAFHSHNSHHAHGGPATWKECSECRSLCGVLATYGYVAAEAQPRHPTSTPPAVPVAALAAVVEAYALQEEQSALDEDAGDVGEEVQRRVARHEGRAEGAREVLRRAPGGAVPRVFTLSHVETAMRRESGNGAWRDVWPPSVLRRLATLDLTLPTGPGGGETAPEPPPMRVETGPDSIAFFESRNPRVTPAVSPLAGKEVPTGTLVAVSPSFVKVVPRDSDAAAEAWARADQENDARRREWAASVRRPTRAPEPLGPMTDEQARATLTAAGLTPERVQAGLDRAMAMVREAREMAESQPEHTAPEVLLTFETDGYVKECMRVLASGALEVMSKSGQWVPSVNEAGKSIARALGEAKRELAASIAETAQVTAELDTWMERCRKARAERDAATERATAAKVETRKAAEDMRERARQCVFAAIDAGRLKMVQGGPLADEIAALEVK